MIQRDLCSWRPPPPRRRRQPYPRANGRSDPPSCSQPGADTTITNMQLPEVMSTTEQTSTRLGKALF
uniref:Uncharacterized protein n=1 Tax=Oryza barthii TaxID=65489 RepID=A0A0D3HD52_9ORYZ